MSAECDKCGSDLVYVGEWPNMECPACSAEDRFNALLSAAKQWKQATESRLRLLDSRGEAAKAMLPADRALIEVIDRLSQSTKDPTNRSSNPSTEGDG